MEIENKLRQRVDLQETRRQQLEYKELKKKAEMEEEEEFRKQVNTLIYVLHLLSLTLQALFLPSLIPFPPAHTPYLTIHGSQFVSFSPTDDGEVC